MRTTLLVAVIVTAVANISWGRPSRVGLLTHDFGIVTDQDLAEELQKCAEIKPFPDQNGCFKYWQCLPTQSIILGCKDLGVSDEFGRDAEVVFTVQDQSRFHHYYTRRNFGLEACEEWVAEWQEVLRNEDIACFSGTFDGQEGDNFYWTIDRLKSAHGEWSYFARGKDFSIEPTLTTDQRIAKSFPPERRSLLSPEDIEIESQDRANGPALQALPDSSHPWSSYAQWLCVDTDRVVVDRTEVTYEGRLKKIPQLNVEIGGHFLEIALSAEREEHPDALERRWQFLLRNSPAVCIYAAYLRGSESESLWTIFRVKTIHGTWVEGDL